uniref:Uncharacterized protein n=1 Tax=Parastrongyloides trichosuri TaxID=131310 RepID=A0A0N5A381_PARTI
MYVLHRCRQPRVDPKIFNNAKYYTIVDYNHANYEGVGRKKMEFELLIEIDNYPGQFWAHEDELDASFVSIQYNVFL